MNSTSEATRQTRVAAVVLAAGLSERFDHELPKQLFQVDGESLTRRTVRRLLESSARPVVVVVGHRGDEVAATVEDLEVEVVRNPNYRDGQSTSVRAGLAAIERLTDQEVDGVLFAPCDQPYLDGMTVDRLLRSFAAEPSSVVRPSYDRRAGAPVIFPRRYFEELARIDGDEGGRQLLADLPADAVVDVELPSPRPLLDLDHMSEGETQSLDA